MTMKVSRRSRFAQVRCAVFGHRPRYDPRYIAPICQRCGLVEWREIG
jgi:hypothetical protein